MFFFRLKTYLSLINSTSLISFFVVDIVSAGFFDSYDVDYECRLFYWLLFENVTVLVFRGF